MGALFGLLASLSITSMEFFSRKITNEVGPIVAAAAGSLIAAVITVGIALVGGGDLIGRDLLLGAGSGLGFGLGLSTYLHGLRISSSAVICWMHGVVTPNMVNPIGGSWVCAAGSSRFCLTIPAIALAPLARTARVIVFSP